MFLEPCNLAKYLCTTKKKKKTKQNFSEKKYGSSAVLQIWNSFGNCTAVNGSDWIQRYKQGGK